MRTLLKPFGVKTRLGLAAGLLFVSIPVSTRSVRTAPQSVDLGVSGRTNATPSIAALDRVVVVVWGATASGATDVYSAVSRDGGQTFGAPVRVNDTAGDARLSGEQPPHVVLQRRSGRDPIATVVWTSRHESGAVLLQSQSADGGRTFAPAKPLPGSEAAGNRGWEAIAIDWTGRVGAAWLDHREATAQAAGAAMSHADHMAHEGSGTEAAQKSKLYFATLDGALAPRAITGGVCYCCKTAIATGPNNAVYLAWRHVYPGDVRDIAFAASHDGGRTFTEPQRVSQDGWAINGCPENGPTMVVDARNAIHVAWPTLVPGPQPALGLFYASSADGRSFGHRERLATRGTPSHAQMTLDRDGGLVLVWDEVNQGSRQIMMSRTPVSGGDFSAPVALTRAGRATFPVVAGTSDAVVVAWTSGAPESSTIHVQQIGR